MALMKRGVPPIRERISSHSREECLPLKTSNTHKNKSPPISFALWLEWHGLPLPSPTLEYPQENSNLTDHSHHPALLPAPPHPLIAAPIA